MTSIRRSRTARRGTLSCKGPVHGLSEATGLSPPLPSRELPYSTITRVAPRALSLWQGADLSRVLIPPQDRHPCTHARVVPRSPRHSAYAQELNSPPHCGGAAA